MQAATNIRTAKADRPRYRVNSGLMQGMETAADLLGQAALASLLGMDPRSLRRKIAAARGVSSADLMTAATALDDLALRAANHARKLREEALA